MFTFGPKPKTALEKAIDDLLREMDVVNADSDEYAKMVKQLVKLYSLKEIDSPRRVSPDTLLVVFGNIVIAVVIVAHERAHVVATKALQFVTRTNI